MKSYVTHKIAVIALILFTLTFGASAFAQTTVKNSMGFESWVERLRNQAFSKGISIDTLQNTFLRNQQMDLSSQTAQQSTNPTPDLIQNNLTFSKLLLRQYGDVLFEISHLFGVNSEVLVAIASLENEATESYPAIDVLINQSFLHPKDINLQNELLQALKIIDEGQISLQQLKSDLQGKLGKIRFKPTIYRDYAIDFDNDGRYDIWQSYADIFASTANYLSNIGWKSGQSWGIEVGLPEEFDAKLININQQRSLTAWQETGIFQADGNELPTASDLGSLIQVDNDRFYIVMDNYFTLLRWKRSTEYAQTVAQLIDLIENKKSISSIINPESDLIQQENPSIFDQMNTIPIN